VTGGAVGSEADRRIQAYRGVLKTRGHNGVRPGAETRSTGVGAHSVDQRYFDGIGYAAR
jgi:hypothetical protein